VGQISRVIHYLGVAGSSFEAFAKGVGEAIRRARERADLTQEDAAHEADLSLRHYQLLEGGRGSNATLKSLYAIAQAVGTTVSQIVADAETRKR
jgi:transcriptional regulator with XRE-family HTH domain